MLTAKGVWNEAHARACAHPVLSPERERMLFKRRERGDDAAREELMRCNHKLVALRARAYATDAFPYEDALSAGYIGLIRACEKFDWRLGFKFSTYAMNWINQAIVRERAKFVAEINQPFGVREQLATIRRLESAAAARGERISIDEVAAALEVDEAEARELLDIHGRRMLSLDRPLTDGEGTDFGYWIAADDDTEEDATRALESSVVGGALAGLPERERQVIEALYLQGKTLPQVAAELGIDQPAARALERSARVTLSEGLAGVLT